MKYRTSAEVCNELLSILSNYCGERGDNESAVETLKRLVRSIKPNGFLFQMTFFATHDLAPYHLEQNLHFEKKWLELTKASGLELVQLCDGSEYDGLWRKL